MLMDLISVCQLETDLRANDPMARVVVLKCRESGIPPGPILVLFF